MTCLNFPPEFLKKLSAIKLIAMDVDGVLTQGEVIYTESGDEIKIFNAKDGHGLSMLAHHNFPVALITGRNSPIVDRRAKELKIGYVYQGVKQKLDVLLKLIQELKISLDEVLYIGDDTPDICVLEAVGIAVCPYDAMERVKKVCQWITENHGGKGAVREVIDELMAAQKLEDPCFKTGVLSQ